MKPIQKTFSTNKLSDSQDIIQWKSISHASSSKLLANQSNKSLASNYFNSLSILFKDVDAPNFIENIPNKSQSRFKIYKRPYQNLKPKLTLQTQAETENLKPKAGSNFLIRAPSKLLIQKSTSPPPLNLNQKIQSSPKNNIFRTQIKNPKLTMNLSTHVSQNSDVKPKKELATLTVNSPMSIKNASYKPLFYSPKNFQVPSNKIIFPNKKTSLHSQNKVHLNFLENGANQTQNFRFIQAKQNQPNNSKNGGISNHEVFERQDDSLNISYEKWREKRKKFINTLIRSKKNIHNNIDNEAEQNDHVKNSQLIDNSSKKIKEIVRFNKEPVEDQSDGIPPKETATNLLQQKNCLHPQQQLKIETIIDTEDLKPLPTNNSKKQDFGQYFNADLEIKQIEENVKPNQINFSQKNESNISQNPDAGLKPLTFPKINYGLTQEILKSSSDSDSIDELREIVPVVSEPGFDSPSSNQNAMANFDLRLNLQNLPNKDSINQQPQNVKTYIYDSSSTIQIQNSDPLLQSDDNNTEKPKFSEFGMITAVEHMMPSINNTSQIIGEHYEFPQSIASLDINPTSLQNLALDSDRVGNDLTLKKEKSIHNYPSNESLHSIMKDENSSSSSNSDDNSHELEEVTKLHEGEEATKPHEGGEASKSYEGEEASKSHEVEEASKSHEEEEKNSKNEEDLSNQEIIKNKENKKVDKNLYPKVKKPDLNESVLNQSVLNLSQSRFEKFLDMSEVKITNKLDVTIDGEGNKRINNYILGKHLGSGGFGKVRHAVCVNDNKEYAVKIANKDKLKRKFLSKKETALTLLQQEIAVMKLINHPNTVKLYEVIDDANEAKLYLVMDYVQKGAILSKRYWKKEMKIESILADVDKQTDYLTEKKCYKYFRDFMLGLDYLHNCAHIIHRDIKPENLLIDDNDTLKIADFGISCIFSESSDHVKDQQGTKCFMAPELWGTDIKTKGKPLDIWAVGCTLYYFAVGKPPFTAKDGFELKKKILQQEPEYPTSLNPNMVDLIQKCLIKDPNNRITLEEILQHSWVTNDGKEPLYNEEYYLEPLEVTNTDKFKAITKKAVSLSTVIKARSRFSSILGRARENIKLNASMC